MASNTEIKNAKLLEKQQKKENKKHEKQVERLRIRVHNEMTEYQKQHAKEKKKAPAGSYISLKNINKIYPNHVQAVYDFNLEVKEHEFIVLVGPSGCGKSTTLRMIAGLEDITAGDLFIDGTYANDLHPKDREIAMVFQSYALYPHMTVAGNMAFSLKIRKFPTLLVDKEGNPILKINKRAIRNLKLSTKNLCDYKESNKNKLSQSELDEIQKDIDENNEKIAYLEQTPVECYVNRHLPKEEISKRVKDASDILQIQEYLNRKPKALSGGQCQRVALGRAIVRNAKVFLMDEPLSNLDAKLRVTMRSEIIRLHEALKATTIYVTHDQTEAMTMASRIVVMSKGYVQQIDTPINIYNHPKNIFVATFIGSPSMNLLKAQYDSNKLIFKNGYQLPLNKEQSKKVEEFYKNAVNNCEEKIKNIDINFVERNELLAAIEKESDSLKKEKLEKELVIVEEANKDRKYYVDLISKYRQMNSEGITNVIFGIRPEDIIKASTHDEGISPSKPIKFGVTVAELLGHEYFAHGYFEGDEIVAKIQTKQIINPGDIMDICFDMDRIHIFDSISEETII